jgi:hypothetical protein
MNSFPAFRRGVDLRTVGQSEKYFEQTLQGGEKNTHFKSYTPSFLWLEFISLLG